MIAGTAGCTFEKNSTNPLLNMRALRRRYVSSSFREAMKSASELAE
jgi:hypothetical protein